MKARVISYKYNNPSDITSKYPSLTEHPRSLYKRWRVDEGSDIPVKEAIVNLYSIEDLYRLSKEMEVPLTVGHDLNGEAMLLIMDEDSQD